MTDENFNEELFDPSVYMDDADQGKQIADNTYTPPPSGANVVVCVGLQRKFFSSRERNGDGKWDHYGKMMLRLKVLKNLKVTRPNDATKAKMAEGKSMEVELWMDLTKPQNAKQFALFQLAVGNTEKFNPYSDDEALQRVVAGIPFGLVHEHFTESWMKDNERKTKNKFKVLAFSALIDDKVKAMVEKEISEMPDFSKRFQFEFLETDDNRKDNSQGSGSGSSGGSGDNGFYDDSDSDGLPF